MTAHMIVRAQRCDMLFTEQFLELCANLTQIFRDFGFFQYVGHEHGFVSITPNHLDPADPRSVRSTVINLRGCVVRVQQKLNAVVHAVLPKF